MVERQINGRKLDGNRMHQGGTALQGGRFALRHGARLNAERALRHAALGKQLMRQKVVELVVCGKCRRQRIGGVELSGEAVCGERVACQIKK
jgi:hypothetical protein